MKNKKIDYELSCGNVFADLGLPDAQELFARADLLCLLHDILEKRIVESANMRMGDDKKRK